MSLSAIYTHFRNKATTGSSLFEYFKLKIVLRVNELSLVPGMFVVSTPGVEQKRLPVQAGS